MDAMEAMEAAMGIHHFDRVFPWRLTFHPAMSNNNIESIAVHARKKKA
jgi:hypothetical protein